MTFSPECSWPFEARGTFWAIFEKFPLVRPLHFFRKCGFWVTLQKLPSLGHSGIFGAAFLPQNLLQSLPLKCILIRGSCHLRQCAFGPFKRGLLFGRFLKNFSWSPLCTFSEKAGLGWRCENCHNLVIRDVLELLFVPNSSSVFAL